MMFLLLLVFRWLMAFQASDSAACSNSSTTEYCSWAWHSAHLPDARTESAPLPAVSDTGRLLLMRNALTISANPIITAMKTERNGTTV
jgi:hypothetical protein